MGVAFVFVFGCGLESARIETKAAAAAAFLEVVAPTGIAGSAIRGWLPSCACSTSHECWLTFAKEILQKKTSIRLPPVLSVSRSASVLSRYPSLPDGHACLLVFCLHRIGGAEEAVLQPVTDGREGDRETLRRPKNRRGKHTTQSTKHQYQHKHNHTCVRCACPPCNLHRSTLPRQHGCARFHPL